MELVFIVLFHKSLNTVKFQLLIVFQIYLQMVIVSIFINSSFYDSTTNNHSSQVFSQKLSLFISAKLSEDTTNIIKEVITVVMITPQILFQKAINCILLLIILIVVDYEKAIQTIQSSFQSEQSEQLKQTHFSFLDSQLDKQSKEMIRSIGCLLTFLPSYLSQDCFEGDISFSIFHSFKPLQLSDYMSIDKV